MRWALVACCLSLGAISTTASAATNIQVERAVQRCDRNLAPLNNSLRRILLRSLEGRAITRTSIAIPTAQIDILRRSIDRINRQCVVIKGRRFNRFDPRQEQDLDAILRRHPRLIGRAWAEIAAINKRLGVPPDPRQRVGVATALPNQPNVILADSLADSSKPILFFDLGFPFTGDTDLPNSNQFVVHNGRIGGAIGGSYSFPGTSSFFERGFWWAVGFYFTHIHSSPKEVGNKFLPGVLPLSGGHSDMTAGFLTGGFRVRPFDGRLSPVELMVLGGLGLAYNNTSLLGPGGGELLSSKYTALAWMGRVAVKYWINEYVALGMFATYLGAQQGYASLTGGGSVPYGGPSVWMLGLTLAIALNAP